MAISLSKPFKDVFKNEKTVGIFMIIYLFAFNNLLLDSLSKNFVSALKANALGISFLILAFLIISFFLSIVFSGFTLQYMKNEIVDDENTLPTFKKNFFYFLKKGAIFTLGIISLWFVFSIFLLLIMVFSRIFFIPYLWNIIFVTFVIFLLIVSSLFSSSFAEKNNLKDTFINFKEILLVFKYAPLELLTTSIMCVFGFFLYSICAYITGLIHYLLLVSIVLYAFINVYCVNLWAQTWKAYRKNYKELKDREDWLKTPD